VADLIDAGQETGNGFKTVAALAQSAVGCREHPRSGERSYDRFRYRNAR
jgi:hypothetical protein